MLSISRIQKQKQWEICGMRDLGLPRSKKLCQDMPIRWNSTNQMIGSVLLYKQVYIHHDLVNPDFRHGLFEDERKGVELVATYFRASNDIKTFFPMQVPHGKFCISLMYGELKCY